MDILIEEFEENIWTVALEKGRIEGLEIDPPFEEVRWGSIYWAKVTRIDAGLDAAFVLLDEDNTGILYNRDVYYPDKDGKIHRSGDKAIGKVLSPGDMIAVQAKSAYIANAEEGAWDVEDKTVQVSMDITIPGRYLVYRTIQDHADTKNKISARIRGKALREKLDNMVNALEDMRGFILRASAVDLQTEILLREARVITHMWSQIEEHLNGQQPCLVMLGPDAIQRTLSDQAVKPIESIEVVTMDHFRNVEDWCEIFAPDLITKITPLSLENATQDLALFEYRDILGQIESLFHDYAFLEKGSNIIIQKTAALTAIDVNKSSDKRGHLDVNIDAAREASRQIRLRNLGGIIVIDFLKMNKTGEKALIKELNALVFDDPCTIQIHGFTKLGLMEMTRKRRTAPLRKRFEGIAL